MMCVKKLFVVLALFFGLLNSYSQNNWDGDNPLGNFTYCSNWYGNTCPSWNSSTDLIFNYRNNTSQTSMFFDETVWRSVRDIRYQNTFAAGIPLDGNGNGIDFYGKIENYTTNYLQTINIPLSGKNGSVIELNPVDGPLTFNQPIYNNNNVNFNVYGNNGKKLTLNSYPQGNASVRFYLKQYSTVEVNYNNAASLSGGFVVESGELWVNANGVIQGPIQVGNSTPNYNKIYISNATTATTVANAISVPTNSPFASIGGLNTSGTHTYSGTINLNNNDVNFDEVSSGGILDFTNIISGTGGVRKIGSGLVRLSANNTYTGATAINGGTLQLGNNNAIASGSRLILNGGTFSTGLVSGFSNTFGTLALTDNSALALGTGTHTLNFAASNATTWTSGKTLTINGWNANCAKGRIFVGNSATALTTAQLAQITFQGYPAGAKLTAVGELIPGNISLTATGGTLTGSYQTLKAAFDAINSGTHSGVISILVLNDTNEAVSAILNNNTAVTSVSIQPSGCGGRTITGSVSSTSLIDFFGADNVTIDGLNTNGNSLTIVNTNTGANGTSTIRFRKDATFNTVTNCTILGSSTANVGANGGNIWFAADSVIGGNDNITISNCNIGPAGVNLPSKGIYFTGTQTADLENNDILITNNNIYDCFATLSSAGIDLNNGSTAVVITNNRIYQTAVRTPTAAGSHTGIRVSGGLGNGFVVSGNAIGYANAAGTGTYTINSPTSSNFTMQGIQITSGTANPSSVQGNTIAGISITSAPTSSTIAFSGIVVSGGFVNVGNVAGNTIGLPLAPINVVTTSSTTTVVHGINIASASTSPLSIYNNVIQSIRQTGIAATPLNFYGIVLNSSAAYDLRNNTIGNAIAANSISTGTLGTSTGASIIRGISSSGSGNLNIGALGFPNTVQNIIANASANNNIRAIETSGATTTVSYNVIKGMQIASAANTTSQFTGIYAVGTTAGLTISNNILGDAANGLISYGAAGGNLYGILTSAATVAGSVTITGNEITGINNPFTSTAQHQYINNNISCPSINISDNKFTNLVSNTSAGTIFLVNTANLPAGGTKTINNNRIVGTFSKTGASGSLHVYFDNGTSAAGATVVNSNNNFSNITVAGTSSISGWANTEIGLTVKTITNNTFNNWTAASGSITGITASAFGGNSSISGNTVSNFNTTGSITGINGNNTGDATSLTFADNTISNFTGGGLVYGIASNLPITVPTITIQNNNVTGLSSSSSSVSGIWEFSLSASKSIIGNTISNLSTATSPLWGINIRYGGTVSVTNNTISTLSSSANERTLGIFTGLDATTSIAITGNSINGITNASTGPLSRIYALEAAGTFPATVSNNTILNCSSAGAGSLYGIYNSNSGTASVIENNTIGNLNITNTSATASALSGIYVLNGGGNILGNKIYGLANAMTSAGSVTTGIYNNGGNWTTANNMISIINTDANLVYGIREGSASGVRKYFHNSIYLGGSGTGNSTAMVSLAGAELKNNIFYNNRTSPAKNYALSYSGAFLSLNSNNNIFYTVDQNQTVLSSGTDRNFLDWQVFSGGDSNSYSGNPITFTNVNTGDLHIAATCSDAESNGTSVAITTDYDTQTRNATTPDIGADEFTGTKPTNITAADAAICSGNSTTLSATSADMTYVYTWSPATGLNTTTGASVIANPLVTTTYMITATSPSGCVKTKFVTVLVNSLPTAITVTPAVATACLNTTQMFTASPINNSMLSVGIPNTTSLAANTPYRQGVVTSESRVQYLITKSELNALGLNTAAKITSLGFDVTAAGTGAMPNYSISIAATSASVLTATYISTGFTTVYSVTNLTPVLSTNTHVFATPFNWDGNSNLVINICSNGSGGTASTVRATNFTTPMTTSEIATGQCNIATGTTNLVRPVMIFGLENTISWSPVTELFTDASATVPYVIGTNHPTVYVHATAPRIYTATATSPVGGCTISATGTFSTAMSTWNGLSWSPAIPTGNSSVNFAGDYTASENISGCSCTISSGNVVFNEPYSLTLTGGLTVNNNPGTTLTFNNNSSLVQIDDAGINSGIITMQRITKPIYRYDYTFWGTPVSLASNYTLGDLSNSTQWDKFYSWTPTVTNNFGTWAQESVATVMRPGIGYIVRAPQTYSVDPMAKIPYTAYFTGTPNNGIVTTPIYHGTLPAPNYNDDYNLLSNPYASAISAEKFLNDPANVPLLDGTIYFWTHNSAISAANPDPFYGDYIYNYNANDYASWNKLGGTGTTAAAATGGGIPAGFIAAGQAFFTRSSATAASGSLATFNNAMRVADSNSQFFKTTNSDFEKHRIWLNLVSNGGTFSQILVGYAEGATLGLDRSYDGVFFSEDSSVGFYSVIPGNELVIQGRPLPFTDEDQVPLGFKCSAAYTFSFRIDHFDALFENQDIYIEDKDLGIIHNLKQSPYEFESQAGTFNDRFVLRFNNTVLANRQFDFDNTVEALIFKHQLQVQSSDEIKNITVFDVSGKRLKVYHPEVNSNHFNTDFPFANGIYLVEIKMTDGSSVTKKLISQ